MSNFCPLEVNILPRGTPNNRLQRREGTEFTLPASTLGNFYVFPIRKKFPKAEETLVIISTLDILKR